METLYEKGIKEEAMNVWKWEMDMCCSMHIESLYKQLLLCKEQGMSTGISVQPRYPAAPHDETLFDCVMLYAKSVGETGAMEISGTVFYWSPSKGDWQKSTVIRTFDNLDDCIAWLKNENAASEECAEIFYERC